MPKDIDEAVKAAVRAWAQAKDAPSGAECLRLAKESLDAPQRATLVDEIAEISAELLIEMLTKTEGIDDRPPIEVFELALHPRQAERLGAWAEDQKLTAEALGFASDSWIRRIEEGLSKLGEGSASSPVGAASDETRRVLGAVRESFQNRPSAGKSEKAGIQGILGARSFKSKKDRGDL